MEIGPKLEVKCSIFRQNLIRAGCSNWSRVPTQVVFSNCLCFPCFFPVRRQIFPVPIYVICDYYIHKTDLADLSSLITKIEKSKNQKISKYLLPLESGNLQLEQTKFPVYFLTGIFFCHFPCFPCAVGTMLVTKFNDFLLIVAFHVLSITIFNFLVFQSLWEPLFTPYIVLNVLGPKDAK